MVELKSKNNVDGPQEEDVQWSQFDEELNDGDMIMMTINYSSNLEQKLSNSSFLHG